MCLMLNFRSQLMMPLRRENSDIMSVNNPLIESKINLNDTYDGYTKIPGRDEEKRVNLYTQIFFQLPSYNSQIV